MIHVTNEVLFKKELICLSSFDFTKEKEKKKSVLKITKQKVQIYFGYFSAILAKT